MYSSKFKIFLSFCIILIILGVAGLLIFSKFKSKNKSQNLALVDLSTLDSDSDSLSDKKEQELGTNLYNADTDGDGYSDLEEVKTNHNPQKIESRDLLDEDGDGLTQEDEKKYGTNPKNSDTDYDGHPDGLEIAAGYDPLKTNLDFLANLTPKESSNKEKSAKDLGQSKNLLEGALGATTPSQFESSLENLLPKKEEKSASSGSVDLPQISDQEIKIKKENDQKTVQAYLNFMAIAAFKFLPFSTDFEMQDFVGSIDLQNPNQLKKNLALLSETYFDIKDIEVPNDKEIIAWHKKTLSYLLAAKNLGESWQNSGKEDIYVYLDLFKNVRAVSDGAMGELLPKMQQIAQKYNVELPREDFFQKISK